MYHVNNNKPQQCMKQEQMSNAEDIYIYMNNTLFKLTSKQKRLVVVRRQLLVTSLSLLNKLIQLL